VSKIVCVRVNFPGDLFFELDAGLKNFIIGHYNFGIVEAMGDALCVP
jgi:hypothetical protein